MKKIISLMLVCMLITTSCFAGTFTKTSNGSSISINVEQGKTILIKARDIFGKIFTGWTITGASVADASQKEQTITMGSGNITATANYATPYTVTVEQKANGVISPGTVTVAEGSSQTFTITPDTNHEITDVLVNGSSVKNSLVNGTGDTKTYTMNVNGNKNIVAVYSYTGDEGGNEITTLAGWNAPVIANGLTPVNWENGSWATTTEANWDYNYNSVAETTSNGTVAGNGNGKWANAQTTDGSLYVWIPRYTYKITSGYHSPGNSWNADLNPGSNKIEIKFSNGTTDNNADSYLSHPAFTFGSTELKGIWVAKYEASGGNSATVSSKPEVVSWRSSSVSDMFDNAYNLNRDLESHLMKNVEWGAVAYLTNAIGRIPYINNSEDYITGNAGGSQDAERSNSNLRPLVPTYTWDTPNGVKASTTHNVYGIYDMSGGVCEYVAAYLNSEDIKSNSYLSSLVNSYRNNGSKYVDVYPVGRNNSQVSNYATWSNVKGDAVYETSSNSSEYTSWDGGYSGAPYSNALVFIRGGACDFDSSAGVFRFNYNNGQSLSNVGFRPVLAIP